MVAVASTASTEAAPPLRLRLPYDLEARGSALFIADGLRHQVLRLDLRTRKLTVFAGTGVAGSSGEKGPARKARIDEPTELVFDRAGNLYLTDFSQGRVRRISPRGIITTVARVPDAAGLAVHPDGGSLAIAALDGFVHRLICERAVELIAGNGTTASGGDGGPAAQAQVNRPHDVAYARGATCPSARPPAFAGSRGHRCHRDCTEAARVQGRPGPAARCTCSTAVLAAAPSRRSTRADPCCA